VEESGGVAERQKPGTGEREWRGRLEQVRQDHGRPVGTVHERAVQVDFHRVDSYEDLAPESVVESRAQFRVRATPTEAVGDDGG